jgi:hypothetical protein
MKVIKLYRGKHPHIKQNKNKIKIMNNIFSNKSFMNRYFTAPTSTGPAKTRAERRLEKTKEKAQEAKDATKGKKSSESEEVKRQANKAKRLDKRVKRQEGRAERKKIRKDYKDQKGKRTYVDSNDNPTDEKTTTSRLVTNSLKKQKQIKASRKKQKSEGK